MDLVRIPRGQTPAVRNDSGAKRTFIIKGSAMAKSPIYDALVNSGARTGEYSGVETALSFGDVRREFRELTSGCAVYDLGWRAKVMVAGNDRVRWLNGMVTNNIKNLKVNRGNYNFVLNPQGRILGDLYAYNRGEYLLIDTERSQLETLLTLLRRYIIMDKVELVDKSSDFGAIGVQGPKAVEVLKAVAIEDPGLEPMQLADVTWTGTTITLTRMASDEFVTYEIWGDAETLSHVWKALVEAGAVPVGSEALEKFRVMIAFPKYGIDIRDRDLPQETGQNHALNFTKGCYIGQEIVERIRSRGNVHRAFTKFRLEGELPPIGSKLQADGKDVGEITSANRIPTESGEEAVALGYIRREAIEGAAKITYPGGEAKPAESPVTMAS
jgi:aminomethyltransferase